MKNAIAIVTLSTLLSACAGLHPQPAPAPIADAAPAEVTAIPDPGLVELPSGKLGVEELPSVPLTSDLMFQLLAAEIAFQRGDWQVAFATTFSAAQHTHDPRLARRAFEMAWIAKQPEESLAASRLWRMLAPDRKSVV